MANERLGRNSRSEVVLQLKRKDRMQVTVRPAART